MKKYKKTNWKKSFEQFKITANKTTKIAPMANKWSMNHFDGSQTMSSKRLQLCSCCFCDWVVSHKAGQAAAG